MNWRTKFQVVLLVAALGAATDVAYAGRACEDVVIDPTKTMVAFDTALSLAHTLDQTGQDLVILARQGQNLEKYGVTFSHAAFAVKTEGGWRVYHDLNNCGTARSTLFVQGLADFLADDLISKQVAMVIPAPWLQARLQQVLAAKEEQFRMHETAYSAVAYPFSVEYQNSNGWLLETYARAAAEVVLTNRSDAQQWLQTAGYVPSVIEFGLLTRLGARMFKANVSFDDQPSHLRWQGKITASTGDSVLQFVSQGAMTNGTCHHGKFNDAVCLMSPD
ncbi:MAG: DUF2145 domain-containing protein [Agitococcus sp.]|nr:DUF2145 domain-containing protein [Agitococcus sp.]